MKQCLFRMGVALACLAMAGPLAYAQGGVTAAPLSGIVVDTSGAPVPGASVTVRNEATGASYPTVTNTQGSFAVPALEPGTYTVTVSLTGFKQAVLKGNKLLTATPLGIKVTLEVGGMEETITVEGGAPLVQTQSASISTTVEVNQIMNLPAGSRSALDYVAFLPGVQTPGGTRDSIVSGLDQSAINITLDGLSLQDNYLKTTDGFFARISPRMDIVEEVTVTTAAGSAEASGQGAAQISFSMRRGTNQFSGAVYEYFRRDWLNANTWFNNRDLPPGPNGKAPQAKLKFDNYGVRLAGPVRIPGLFDGRDRVHFFFNLERSSSPADVLRNRIVLSPAAQGGLFQYTAGGATQAVNLLELAARNGQTATVDPVVARVLGDIRNATSQGGVANLADPLVQRFSYQSTFKNQTDYPTLRLDFQLSQKHHLSTSYTLTDLLSDPDTLNGRDPQFPGFPVGGVQDSQRFAWHGTLRSTLTPNLVNELRVFGATGGSTKFSTEINPGMWRGTPVADQAGFNLNFNPSCCGTGQALTNASSGPGLSAREGSTKVAHDRLTWIKGSHSVNFGVDFTEGNVWLWNQTMVPQINFGITSADPAAAMFTTANFPGASTAQLNNARGLYAILTGRVDAIVGNARIDENTAEYKYLGASRARARVREFDFFAHDSWRARSNLTLNYGLRYVLQTPFYPLNNSYFTGTLEDVYGVSGVGNVFKPGTLTGRKPVFVQYEKGKGASKTDINNVAPSLGFAWQPTVESGFLRKVLGSQPVVRGGFAVSYNRNGMSDFTDVYGDNPGIQLNADRSFALNNLGANPLLFRNQGSLGPPPIAPPPMPYTEVITQDIEIFDPNLRLPYSQSWTLSLQRALGSKMAVDLRYIGTRGRDLWANVDYNEANVVENGFLNEFRLAQQNLQSNIRAGRGNTFRYFGPGTGTSPLPIYLGYFSGIPASRAGDASLYTSTSFGSTDFTNPLAIFNPQPYTPAGTNGNAGLDGSAARRANAAAAGIPANFFRVNPDLQGGAEIRSNSGFTNYHGAEIELQRRYSRGLTFRTSYTFGKAYGSNLYTLRQPLAKSLNTGAEGGVTHAFKLFGFWDIPVGKGRRFGGTMNSFLDAVVGGWSLSTTMRVQSGRMLDFGNVRLVGMTPKDLQKAFKLRFDDAGRKVYMLPQDIIDNTRRAFNVQATSLTGYGADGAPTGRYLAPANGPDCIELVDTRIYEFNTGFNGCGPGELVVTGPMYRMVDLGIEKTFKLKGRTRFHLRAILINAFNIVNFTPVTGGGTTATAFQSAANYEVTGSDSPRTAELVARFSW
jgi:carboxypeptidase family protein